MEILKQNSNKLRLINEYMILKRYAIDKFKLIEEDDFVEKEIEILLYEVGRNRLREYFKWLFGRNIYNKKRVFVKEILKKVSEDIKKVEPEFNVDFKVSHHSDMDVNEYYNKLKDVLGKVLKVIKDKKKKREIEDILKMLKLTGTNYDKIEKFINRGRPMYIKKKREDREKERKEREKEKQKAKQKGGTLSPMSLVDHDEVMRLVEEEGLDLPVNPTSPVTRSMVKRALEKKEKSKMNPEAAIFKPLTSKLKMIPEGNEDKAPKLPGIREEKDTIRLVTQAEKIKKEIVVTPKKIGSKFDVQSNIVENVKVDLMLKDVYKMDLEDLKVAMKLLGYPIYLEHMDYLRKLYIQNSKEISISERKRLSDKGLNLDNLEIINVHMVRIMLQKNKIHDDKYKKFRGSLPAPLIDYNNLLSLAKVDLIDEEKGIWIGLIKEIKKMGIQNRSEYLMDKIIFNEINTSIAGVFMNMKKNFQELMMSKTENGFRIKYKDFLYLAMKRSIYSEFYNAFDINARKDFKVPKSKRMNKEDLVDPRTGKDLFGALMGYDRYGKRYDLRKGSERMDIDYYTVNLLRLLKTHQDGYEISDMIEGEDFINFFRYLYDMKEIYVNTWSKRGEIKRANRKRKIKKDERFDNFNQEKLERYYDEFVQDQIFYLIRGYIYTIIKIINRDMDNNKLRSEILKMIRTGDYVYELEIEGNLRIEVRDYLEMILLGLRDNKYMSKEERKFIRKHIIKFITGYKINIAGRDEVTYMELFNTDDLLVSGQRVNSLPVYLQILQQIELDQGDKSKIREIVKKNKEIIGEIVVKGKDYKQILSYGDFTEEEKLIIKEYSEGIIKMISEYKSSVNDKIKDLVEKRGKGIEKVINEKLTKDEDLGEKYIPINKAIGDIREKLSKKSIFDYIRFIVEVGYKDSYKKVMKIRGMKKVKPTIKKSTGVLLTEEEEKNAKLPKHIREIQEDLKDDKQVRLTKEDFDKDGKIKTFGKYNEIKKNKINNLLKNIDRGIVQKQIVEKRTEAQIRMDSYFKFPKSMIANSVDIDDILRRYNRKKDYYKEMMKEGKKIITSFKKKYNLINVMEEAYMKQLVEKFLDNQREFLHTVADNVKNFTKMYSKSIEDIRLLNNRISYEYMLIVCLMMLIVFGVSLEKIDKIDLADVENLINLKGYDKRNRTFVDVIKVSREETVGVKSGNRKYRLKMEQIVIGEFLNVKLGKKNGILVNITGNTGLLYLNDKYIEIGLGKLRLAQTGGGKKEWEDRKKDNEERWEKLKNVGKVLEDKYGKQGLLGYDKKNKRFVKIDQVDFEELVLVKSGTKEYKLRHSEITMSDYLRVKVVGTNIYKGEIGKLVKILGLSEEEKDNLYNKQKELEDNLRNEELTYVERLDIIDEIKRIDYDLSNDIGMVLIYEGNINQKMVKININNLELIEGDKDNSLRVKVVGTNKYKGEIGKLVKILSNDIWMILIYEGSKNEKMIKINKNNLKLIKKVNHNSLLLQRDIHLNLRMKGVKKEWGDSILANIYKAYNNLMIGRRNALGLGYFRILYNKMIKQLNEYYKFANTEIKKRKDIEGQLFVLRKRLKGKRGKMEFGEKDRLKGQVIKLENALKKYKRESKYMISKKHATIKKKDELEKFKKYVNDFNIKDRELYLKKNDKDYKRIEKALGELKKDKDIKDKKENKKKVEDMKKLTIEIINKMKGFSELINGVITGEYLKIDLVKDPQMEIVEELIKDAEEEYDEDELDEDELMRLLDEVTI